MTSFSILYSRFKGDLVTQTLGAMAVETLKPGDRVLIAEACTHHPIGEDIGRVKIPRWLTQYVGGQLDFTTRAGAGFSRRPVAVQTGHPLRRRACGIAGNAQPHSRNAAKPACPSPITA